MADQPGLSWSWSELDPAEIARRALPLFPPGFEQQYSNDILSEKRRDTKRLLLIGLGLFLAGTLSDYSILHEILRRTLVLHLFVHAPLAIALIVVANRARTLFVHDLALTLIALLSATLSLIVFRDSGDLYAMLCAARAVVVIIFSTLVLRQGFRFAIFTNLAVAVVELLALRINPLLTHGTRGVCIGVLVSGTTLSVFASLVLERSTRIAYLLLRQSEENAARLRRANMELAELSHRDGLTGIANRRHFNSFSEKLWKDRRERNAQTFPVSLIMADIDHFKRLNDTHGHLAGDEVLIEVAKILRGWVRTGEDIVARFGGEEFVLMLPGIESAGAVEVAERIVQAVRGQPLLLPGNDDPVHVTISCGVSTVYSAELDSVQDLIATADAALYESKRCGRDRVRWHPPLHPALST